ncbi:MAG: hypothetical protein LKCHEGNO_00462 [Burkholderiaceae bacterium]|nr:hypothetical protein [Burkholderiaceae bacterium]
MTDNSTSSADTYRFGIGYGVDTITDSGGADTVQFGDGLTAGDLVFSHVGNNLEITIAGHGADKLVVANHYVGTASKIETFRLSDGSTLPPAVVPLSSGAREAAALNEPEPVTALREHIMPVRPIRSSIAAAAAPEATVPPGRGRAYAPLWQPATLRDLDWPEPAIATAEVPITSALIARQAQSLVSAMAAFGGEQAAFDSERPTVLPVHRPEPMWVSPAVM